MVVAAVAVATKLNQKNPRLNGGDIFVINLYLQSSPHLLFPGEK